MRWVNSTEQGWVNFRERHRTVKEQVHFSLKQAHFDLHRTIRTAWTGLQTYDEMVERLAYICETNTEVFTTFKDVLHKAHELLDSYWGAIQDQTKSIKERKEASMEHIDRLDAMAGTAEFYYEFSRCVDVDRLIRELGMDPRSF